MNNRQERRLDFEICDKITHSRGIHRSGWPLLRRNNPEFVVGTRSSQQGSNGGVLAVPSRAVTVSRPVWLQHEEARRTSISIQGLGEIPMATTPCVTAICHRPLDSRRKWAALENLEYKRRYLVDGK